VGQVELLERIAAHLASEPDLPAEEIARVHLRLLAPGGIAAAGLVRAVLGRDRRFVEGPAGRWRIALPPQSSLQPPVLLLDLAAPAGSGREPWLWRAAATPWDGSSIGRRIVVHQGGERSDALAELAGMLDEHPVATEQASALGRWLSVVERMHALPEPEATVVDLRAWRRLRGGEPGQGARAGGEARAAADAAPEAHESGEDLHGRLARLAEELESVRAAAQQRGLHSWAEVAAAPGAARERAELELRGLERGFAPADLDAVPEAPGIYRFFDRGGCLLYVGKSKNLRRRLAAHLGPAEIQGPRAARLREIHRFECETSGSELEALIREAREIRERGPAWNIRVEFGLAPADPAPSQRDLLLLLPGAGAPAALFALAGERAAWRRLAADALPAPRALEAALAAFFRDGALPEGFEEIDPPERVLVRRYLAWGPEEAVILRPLDFPAASDLATAVLSGAAAGADPPGRRVARAGGGRCASGGAPVLPAAPGPGGAGAP